MELGDAVAEVLRLQQSYSSANTDDMKRRGDLIRNVIPASLEQLRYTLAQAIDLDEGSLLIEGRDGTGRKSGVPWVRFASKALSPSATTGWYVVLLHRRDGTGVYLALAHGSTQFQGGSLIPRSDEELARLVAWGRATLSDRLIGNPSLVSEVRLGTKAPLAVAYEKSCVSAFYYPASSLPEESVLLREMMVLADMLGRLYRAERLGQMPLSGNPDIRDAGEAVAEISRPSRDRAGQGFALTALERRVIEVRAMRVASAHLQELGFNIKDVSATESFDLLASRGSQVVSVEVKGTTGGLGAILLTSNEVELHKREYPENALLVVHDIELTERDGNPVASGGTLKMWMPWLVDDGCLRGLTYAYQLH